MQVASVNFWKCCDNYGGKVWPSPGTPGPPGPMGSLGFVGPTGPSRPPEPPVSQDFRDAETPRATSLVHGQIHVSLSSTYFLNNENYNTFFLTTGFYIQVWING